MRLVLHFQVLFKFVWNCCRLVDSSWSAWERLLEFVNLAEFDCLQGGRRFPEFVLTVGDLVGLYYDLGRGLYLDVWMRII